MKKYTLLLLATILNACSPTITKEYSYKLNNEMTCSVGDVIMMWERGGSSLLATVSVKYELIYLGIDRTTMQVKYHEYTLTPSGYLIRDAFSQDLKYDISKSDTIFYKQARIKVVNADQRMIKYVILSHPE